MKEKKTSNAMSAMKEMKAKKATKAGSQPTKTMNAKAAMNRLQNTTKTHEGKSCDAMTKKKKAVASDEGGKGQKTPKAKAGDEGDQCSARAKPKFICLDHDVLSFTHCWQCEAGLPALTIWDLPTRWR